MTRVAYWVEFREAIEKGAAREIAGYEAIEVKTSILMSVRWKTKVKVVRGGEVVREVWREYSGLIEYKAGEVLHREWRPASEWEIEEWRGLPEDKLKELGVYRKNGELSVKIVEKIKDLPAAIRQRGRHIPSRMIARERKQFEIPGDAQLLAIYATRLFSLLKSFLEYPNPSPQLSDRVSLELIQISQLLERSRISLKRRALEEIRGARQGIFWEVPAKTSQAAADLLNQRVKDYEIAIKSIELAEKWQDLMAGIERRFRDCYNRLGQLGEHLQSMLAQSKAIKPEDLLPIASEACGIWKHLTEKVPNFNPYYERLQSPEFQRLSKTVIHAKVGRAETVLNDIKGAVAKLEAIALGERVTRAELQKKKAKLF